VWCPTSSQPRNGFHPVELRRHGHRHPGADRDDDRRPNHPGAPGRACTEWPAKPAV